MLRTRLSQEYGLEMPLVCAGMGFIGMPPLVAAVSNAGGMGTLGAAPMPPDAVRAVIQAIRTLTEKPFGVNFITQFTEDDHIDVCIEEQVPVVSFHWNDPPATYIEHLRAAGVKVWMQVGSVPMAREVAQLGVN